MYISLIWVPISFLAGWLISRWLSFAGFHLAGQLAMKEKIRQQINTQVKNGNIIIEFKDRQKLNAEQLLQFMCHGVNPDPNEPSHGVSSYTPD